jgi:DNA-3-methyladenine glycosylase I
MLDACPDHFLSLAMKLTRCEWLPANLDAYRDYHDHEWGVPTRDPRYLFEMICLEGAQAGLSWWTVLRKRERYREVFHQFEPEAVAAMTDAELEALMGDEGIIRHRGKIFAVRQNARAWLALEAKEGSAVDYLWSFIGGQPRQTHRQSMADLPAKTPESEAMSKALRREGFNFVGATTLYAFMQGVGMVNDHTRGCFRCAQLA